MSRDSLNNPKPNNQHQIDGDLSELGGKDCALILKDHPIQIIGPGHQLISHDDDDYESSCGIFYCHPRWLQHFANKQCFLVLFCLTSVLQGIYYTYFVSVLTTIEKLYQVQSKTTGLLMSSTEIGQISGVLLLTYYGGKGHRPRWIATGMLVFAFAALLCSTPHYLFGSQPVLSSNPHTANYTANLCLPNRTTDQSCSGDGQSHIGIERSQVTNSVLGIFFLSLLMIGLGTTAVNTLGIPYIDDNVAPQESPLYFGITIGIRIFGPVCGFLLGSICTSIPVQFPFGYTDLTPTDANWIGAWWLGLFLVGISLALTAIPMMIFPRRLPKPDPSSYCHQQQQKRLIYEMKCQSKGNEPELAAFCDNQSNKTNANTDNHHENRSQLIEYNGNEKSVTKNEGFFTALKRLLSNDILLCRTASSVLHILPISGLYTFLPKYLESQFQLTASNASMISGLAGILVMGIGIFASGTFMRKYNPSAKFVARWIALAAIFYVIGMCVLMFLGCPTNQFAGLKQQDHFGNDYIASANNSELTCSAHCHCPMGRFDPVCGADGTTYISPCIAGCTTLQANSSTDKQYVGCSCTSMLLPELTSAVEQNAKPGLCSLQCNILPLYIVIFSVTVLIHSTSEVGAMLLTLRCVQPQDKAMALGFISFATGLFGNVPCSIIYGAIVDSTCLFWEEDCGKRGACRLYDPTRFRQRFHGLTAFIMFMAFCIDLIMCYKAKAIQLNDHSPLPEMNGAIDGLNGKSKNHSNDNTGINDETKNSVV